METKILCEITPLGEHDFMYVADRHKQVMDNPYKCIYQMMMRAKHGLSFPRQAIMKVYQRLANLISIEDKFLMSQELFLIFYELSKFDDARELATSSFSKVNVSSESRRVLKVKNYICTHVNDDLRLEKLADLIGMTPTSFSRFFRQRTGKNLSEYIIDIRLGCAARLLVDTTDSISEICYSCGFNTLSNFNRLFRKRKGCTPTEFREKYHKTKIVV